MMKEAQKAIVEMKNTSELMLDLAYSALIYQNRDIAKEVIELEEQTDELYEVIIRRSLEIAKSPDGADRSMILMKMADAIERIADSALDIADVVLRNIELHPVIKKSFEESDVIMMKEQVKPGSYLDGKTLGEVKLASETGVWVIAIKRGSNWKYGPNEKTEIKQGDVLFARAPEESEEVFKKWV